jgi:hypothetical protein
MTPVESYRADLRLGRVPPDQGIKHAQQLSIRLEENVF